MIISVPRESAQDEQRVALIPEAVARLTKLGVSVHVEAGAGTGAHFSDQDFATAGATIVADKKELWGKADILVKVKPPQEDTDCNEVDLLKPGATFIGFLNPLGNPNLVQRLAQRNITAFSMEMIPRISRAQNMDALSSQASIAGYKAVLIAAATLGKFFPMLTTAAGTVRPAIVLIIGVGVAGLQAIATARRLGAVVKAFDIRPVVKEQVESLGAEFVGETLDEEAETAGGYAKEVSKETQKREHEILSAQVAAADVVITTAQVPGKPAPELVPVEMVTAMRSGSVIVDLAAEQGGNCALSQADQVVQHQGVSILAPTNLAATLPIHASQMYARNVSGLVQHLVKEGVLQLDFADEITDGACVTHKGEITNPIVREQLGNA